MIEKNKEQWIRDASVNILAGLLSNPNVVAYNPVKGWGLVNCDPRQIADDAVFLAKSLWWTNENSLDGFPDWIPTNWWVTKDRDGTIRVWKYEPILCRKEAWHSDECGMDEESMILPGLHQYLPKYWLDLNFMESKTQIRRLK